MTDKIMQFADEAITRKKFEEALNEFNASKEHYRKLGVILLDVNYPRLYFGFAATGVTPAALPFATCIDFTNYDVEPLSVKFIHPISFAPLSILQMPNRFLRKMEDGTFVELLQAGLDQVPFFCIPGVREYHQHPVHTGNAWFRYRGTNEGKLCFILDNIHRYGTGHIGAYSHQLIVNSQVAGLVSLQTSLPS